MGARRSPRRCGRAMRPGPAGYWRASLSTSLPRVTAVPGPAPRMAMFYTRVGSASARSIGSNARTGSIRVDMVSSRRSGLEVLHGDPRFEALVRRVGIPDDDVAYFARSPRTPFKSMIVFWSEMITEILSGKFIDVKVLDSSGFWASARLITSIARAPRLDDLCARPRACSFSSVLHAARRPAGRSSWPRSPLRTRA